ncbi:MAG: c-type cytochrome, partial [Planctomycetaceae bacterium]|nr:c-type cytochrome [Planctomycetaceae bacterium]
HSLHDFAWTPDGDLIFRESIFHHSQVETPWGPVRQQNSGWFRMNPRRHHLLSFGTYHSTNPWGVTFDDWGNHVASHPVFAAAFHSLDPPYPQQHPRPVGLQAYSGVCGHEFVDFDTFPDDLQGDHFIKVRYKPTNRVEILKWKETEFGYEEEYVSDLVFSTNLSFIPVDLRYGPDGAMYVCDWYNPVKGHAQYSLRDERRDRHSGRIWRITAKDKPTLSPPNFAEMSVGELVATLGRREYRYRYWAKRELRERDSDEVRLALNNWLAQLDKADPRYPHHQLEALWTGRSVGQFDVRLLRELLESEDHHARAAAVQQIRYTDRHLDDEGELLMRAAQDPKGLVRMEAAIAASYVGTPEALEAVVQTLNHPVGGHLAYAIRCSLGSEKLRAHWETDPSSRVPTLMARLEKSSELKEPKPSAAEAEFDRQPNLATIQVSCVPERMRFSMEEIAVFAGQPVKIVFSNPDANDHNFVLVKPGALEEVGMAANEMAKDPKNANSDFIPQKKRSLILDHSPMIGPNRKTQIHVLRFVAPEEPGVYPFVCTFPGHWVVMKGNMAVGETLEAANKMLADLQPQIVREWSLADFPEIEVKQDEQRVMRGMNAFMKARCTQCHKVAGHGVELGPDLADVAKRFQGKKLLQQLLEPSVEINKKFQPQQFILKNGKVVAGVVMEETDTMLHVVSNLLTPQMVTKVPVAQIEERIPSRVSPMPTGLLNVLQRDEILDLLTFLESGGYKLPDHIHGHHHK